MHYRKPCRYLVSSATTTMVILSLLPAVISAQVVERSYETEDIVVSGTKTEKLLIDSQIKTEVIRHEDIARSGCKNLYELLDKRLIPNVWVETSCTNCAFSSVRMQGLESGYSMILVDGQPVYSALASIYGLRQILSENIDRIEVVKGAGSALYGSAAIGGVINIITRDPGEEPESTASVTYGDYNTVDISATTSLRKDNLAMILGVQKYQTDYADENGANGEADLFTDRVERDNNSLSLKLHYYFDDDQQRLTTFGRYLHEFRRGGFLGAGTVTAYDDDGNPYEVTIPHAIDNPTDPGAEHITTDRWEYGFGYRGNFANGGTLRANCTGTHHERVATNGARPFESKEDILFAESIYSHPAGESNLLTGGLSYRDEQLSQVINYEQTPDTDAQVVGIYFQDELTISERVDLVLGARYDNTSSSLVDDSAVSPRIGVKFDLNQNVVMRLSSGAGFRVPYLFAEDLHLCSAAPTTYVSPDIEPEKSWSNSLSISRYGERFTTDISVYRTDISKKIALDFWDDSDADFVAGTDAVYRNAGDATVQGIEWNGRCQITDPLAFSAGFVYNDATFEKAIDPSFPETENLMRVPETTVSLAFEYDDPIAGWILNVGARMTGAMFIEYEATDVNPVFAEGYGVDETDPFWILDLRAEKQMNSGKYALFAGCDNVFSETQEHVFNADQEDSAAYIYAPLTGRYFYGGMNVRF